LIRIRGDDSTIRQDLEAGAVCVPEEYLATPLFIRTLSPNTYGVVERGRDYPAIGENINVIDIIGMSQELLITPTAITFFRPYKEVLPTSRVAACHDTPIRKDIRVACPMVIGAEAFTAPSPFFIPRPDEKNRLARKYPSIDKRANVRNIETIIPNENLTVPIPVSFICPYS
jgi:hypothetical protein